MNREDKGRIGWGLILLTAGLLLLAWNLGWVQIDLLTLLARFWPLALILIGLRYFISNPIIFASTTAVLVLGAVWVVSYSPEPLRSQLNGSAQQIDPKTAQKFDETVPNNTKKLTIKLDMDASSLKLGNTDISTQAYQAEFTGFNHITEEVRRHSDRLDIALNEDSIRRDFWRFGKAIGTRAGTIRLNPQIPLEFELDAGASKQVLDFSNIDLRKFKLDSGASSSDIKFGSKADTLEAIIDSGASSLTLRIPRDTGLKIENDSGLSSNNFSDVGLVRQEDTYTSADFATQAHKITLKLETGASSVKLERY